MKFHSSECGYQTLEEGTFKEIRFISKGSPWSRNEGDTPTSSFMQQTSILSGALPTHHFCRFFYEGSMTGAPIYETCRGLAKLYSERGRVSPPNGFATESAFYFAFSDRNIPPSLNKVIWEHSGH